MIDDRQPVQLTKCRGCVVEWSETKNKSCSDVLNPLDWSNRRLVAVVETAGHERCNELGHHIVVDVPSNLFQTSEKQLDAILATCCLSVSSWSTSTPRSRTTLNGWTTSPLISGVGLDGAIFCSVCRVPSQMISDLEEFSCR